MLGLLTLGLAQLEFGFAVDMPSPSWKTKTGMPTARGQAAVVASDDGLIYVLGGFTGSDPPNATVEAYDPLTDMWTMKGPIPTATRGAAVANGLDGLIYLIGGANGTIYLPTVQAYNTTSRTWSQKAAIPTATWVAGAATGDDGKFYVVGGEAPEDYYCNKTQIYDPSTDSWTQGADMPTGRSMLGLVKGSDGLLYAMGGYNGSALSVVEVYNPSTDTWIEKAPMPSPKLEFGIVLGPDDKIYVIGGGTSYFSNEGPFLDTVEVYDPRTDTWITPSWSESVLPTGRKELGAALGINGRIYAIGGTNGTYVGTNEEAFVVPPENIPPTAFIDFIMPNPATRGETISFFGHGTDRDGSVTAYRWRSSTDGIISNSTAFGMSTLSDGMHTIYFSAKDNSDAWSEEAIAFITVKNPGTELPPLEEKIDLLSEQNDNLTREVTDLSQQNTDLTGKVDSLTRKANLMTGALIGTSIVIIILVAPIGARYVPLAAKRFSNAAKRVRKRRRANT